MPGLLAVLGAARILPFTQAKVINPAQTIGDSEAAGFPATTPARDSVAGGRQSVSCTVNGLVKLIAALSLSGDSAGVTRPLDMPGLACRGA
jgi:hypothetical protein